MIVVVDPTRKYRVVEERTSNKHHSGILQVTYAKTSHGTDNLAEAIVTIDYGDDKVTVEEFVFDSYDDSSHAIEPTEFYLPAFGLAEIPAANPRASRALWFLGCLLFCTGTVLSHIVSRIRKNRMAQNVGVSL